MNLGTLSEGHRMLQPIPLNAHTKKTGSPLCIPGCYELQPRILVDTRGAFVKTFHAGWFSELGLTTYWAEQYYSISHQGVLRGLHFQIPPHAHAKLVYCTSGEVFDVALDLRLGSPAYGRHAVINLSADQGNMLYLPAGLAHGFYTLSTRAVLVYNVETIYALEQDCGIRWDTADIAWPNKQPCISDRDQGFTSLANFKSPFIYQAE